MKINANAGCGGYGVDAANCHASITTSTSVAVCAAAINFLQSTKDASLYSFTTVNKSSEEFLLE